MIRHIVLFTLTDKAREDGLEQVVEKIRISAQNMTQNIPGLLTAEFEMNQNKNSPYDVIFYSEFDSVKSLEAYQNHPVHEAHRQFSLEYVSNPQIADLYQNDTQL